MREINFVLNGLALAVKGLPITKTQAVTVTCYGEDVEKLAGYIKASAFLQKVKIIAKYEVLSYDEEDEESAVIGDRGVPLWTWQTVKIKYWVKPQVLVNFMIKTSRMPQYSVKLVERGIREFVVLNDKYILSSPWYGFPTRNLFDVAYNNPRRPLTKKFIEGSVATATRGKEYHLKRRIDGILADLGFTDELRTIFFPHVTKSAIYFRNDVLASELKDQINPKKLAKQLVNLKKL